MKKLVIAAILLVIILTFGIIEQVYVEHILTHAKEMSDSLIHSLKDNNIAEASTIYDELYSYWNKKRDMLSVFFSHNEFRDVPVLLGELEGYIRVGNADEALVRVYVIREDTLNHLSILDFSYSNIF